MRVRISRCVAELIQQAAADGAPREACGLLLGEQDAIDGASIAANVAANPLTHFEIDPAALFAAIRAERAGERRVAGYWHSHPNGDPRPSPTDAASAAPDGRLWLIVAGGEMALWRAGEAGLHGRFEAVAAEFY